MKNLIISKLNATDDELLVIFEAIRDHLSLRSLQNYRKDKNLNYNTLRKKVRLEQIKATEVDGTIYIPKQ